MQILLIRHGQSEADLLDVHEGRADYALTQLGIDQAHTMSNWLRDAYPPDVIWSSPLSRAKQTASILAEAVGCPIIIENALMEWNNGVLAGLKREDARERYPEPKGGHPPHLAVEKGESAIDFRMRAELVFSKIITETQDYNRLAIVSHGGLISQLLQTFLKLPVRNEFLFKTEDTGIHLLEQRGEKRLVHFINRTEHLMDFPKKK